MIKDIFNKLKGYPCYHVKQGHGSYLTFEFGEPHLEIREPLNDFDSISKKLKEHLALRRVTVRGQWHLRIYCCTWEIYYKQEVMADSESSRGKIKKALTYLDGQKLVDIETESCTGNATFYFDLGGKLETKGYVEDIYELWLLYTPDDYVLAIRNDSTYSYVLADTAEEKIKWLQI